MKLKLSPYTATMLVLAAGVALLAGGVYLLAGMGWCLVTISAPFLIAAAILIRGITRV